MGAPASAQPALTEPNHHLHSSTAGPPADVFRLTSGVQELVWQCNSARVEAFLGSHARPSGESCARRGLPGSHVQSGGFWGAMSKKGSSEEPCAVAARVAFRGAMRRTSGEPCPKWLFWGAMHGAIAQSMFGFSETMLWKPSQLEQSNVDFAP